MRKPQRKPTINRMNQQLNKLMLGGWYTYAECVKERGFWARLHKRKRKN